MANIKLLLVMLFVGGCYCRSTRDAPPTWARYQHARNLVERAHRQSRQSECTEKPADLVFVLDGSSSIWGPDFTRQLRFVSNVTKSFDLGPEHLQVGIVTFATNVTEEMMLGDFTDWFLLNKTIMDIEQPLGNTNTDKALHTMRVTMFSPQYARAGKPSIGVVITDGASRYKDKTAREAQLAKDAGITVFAIGVGQNLTEKGVQDELNTIASSPDHVFTVTGYEMLDKLKEELTNRACEATTPAPTPAPPQMIDGCDGKNPLDIIFTAPDEAGIADTELTLDFIQSIVDGFHIGPMQVQAGLAPRLCKDLEGIRLEEHDDKDALSDAIGDRGLTSTQLSVQIEYLLRQGFTVQDGARQNSKKVAVMIVDNRAEDPSETQLVAEDAKAEGITLVIVGVGPHVNRGELSALATSPDHVFFVNSYSELQTLSTPIHRRVCLDNQDQTPPPQMIEGCRGSRAMDVLMAVPDDSGIRQTELALSFLQTVTGSFSISESQVQVGVTPRMCHDLDGISLRTHDESEALKRGISRRRLTSTVVSQQLEYMLEQGFTEEDGGRADAKRFALLMVDNAFADPQLTFDLSAELKEGGVTVIAVGVGPYAEELDLMRVASSADHLFMVDSYQYLDTVLVPVLDAFCRDISY